MKTRTIPRSDWPQFFDSFSRQHEGWLATLEIFATEIGAQVEEHEMAFEGIVDEWNEALGNQIIIMMGAKRDDHITHTVAHPTNVSLEQTDEGADVALAITSEGGAVTLLRFRSPTLPALVDGIVEETTRPSV
ncbi:MAG TPA: DUF5335 family protein [Pyrinomonadaceae bacterium]|nr:DUF5335 family protein [Pyrinomonadaceae bacterium]